MNFSRFPYAITFYIALLGLLGGVQGTPTPPAILYGGAQALSGSSHNGPLGFDAVIAGMCFSSYTNLLE